MDSRSGFLKPGQECPVQADALSVSYPNRHDKNLWVQNFTPSKAISFCKYETAAFLPWKKSLIGKKLN